MEISVKNFSFGLDAEIIETDVHRWRSFLSDDVYRVAVCNNWLWLLVTFDFKITRALYYFSILGIRRKIVTLTYDSCSFFWILLLSIFHVDALAIRCMALFSVWKLRLFRNTKLVVGQIALSEFHELLMSHRLSLYFRQMIISFTFLGVLSVLQLRVRGSIDVFSDWLLVQFKQSSVRLHWIIAASNLTWFFSNFFVKNARRVLANLIKTICLYLTISFPVVNVIGWFRFLESFKEMLIFCRNFCPLLHSHSAVQGWNRLVSISSDLNGRDLAWIACLSSWKNASHFFKQHFVIFFDFSAAL